MAVVTEEAKDASRDCRFSRSNGLPVLCHFLSAALRVERRARMGSVSHGRGWVERTGFVDRGHMLSKQELNVELSVSVAVSTSKKDSVLGGGKAEVTADAKSVIDSLQRFRRYVTTCGVLAGVCGRVIVK